METPIIARSYLAVIPMIEGQRVHRRLTRSKLTRLRLFGYEVLCCVMLSSVFWNLRLNDAAFLLFFVPCVLLILASFAVVNLIVTDRCYGALIRCVLSMRSEASTEIEWTFSTGSIERRAGPRITSLRWDKLWKVAELPTGFLVHQGGELWDWITTDSFAEPGGAREFSRMARVLAKNYVLLEDEVCRGLRPRGISPALHGTSEPEPLQNGR